MGIWQRLVLLAVTIGVILAAFSVLNHGALLRGFQAIRTSTWLLSAALSIMTTLLLALRWVVINAGGANNSFRWQHFADALIGFVFNILTPAGLGADAYRIIISRHRPGGWSRSSIYLIIERIFGISSYALLFLIGYLAMAGTVSPVFDASAILLASLGILPLLVVILPRLLVRDIPNHMPGRFACLTEAGQTAGTIPISRLAAVYGLSLASSAAWLACLMVLAQDAGVDLGWAALVMIGTITELARLVPISVQGAGVREAVFAWLAMQAGGYAEPAFIACASGYALHFALVTFIAAGTKFVAHHFSM